MDETVSLLMQVMLLLLLRRLVLLGAAVVVAAAQKSSVPSMAMKVRTLGLLVVVPQCLG